MTKLLPCPFCGYADNEVTGEPGMYEILCDKCDHAGFAYFHTKAAAVQAWNRRTPPTVPDAMPDTHEATIKQALHWMRDDSRQVLLAYGREFHDDVMARIDKALAYLDSAGGGSEE